MGTLQARHKVSSKERQLAFLKKDPHAYGGLLLNTRAGRARGRPLSTRASMHLVLRSSKAKGAHSMRRHSGKVEQILRRFSQKYGVKILTFANVGNHLHLQIRLLSRDGYKPFIRAITAAIAMAVMGTSRGKKSSGRFWDLRPFTRIVKGWAGPLRLTDYIRVNRLEGVGIDRERARQLVKCARRAGPVPEPG
jgi:REP element-mobilizing transposase RayT